MRFALLGVALTTCFGCRTNDGVVEVVPSIAARPDLERAPSDPFPSSRDDSAYARLRRITDEACKQTWNRELESFEPWIEAQSEAVEGAVSLLRQLRIPLPDQYAIGNGRIALVYHRIVDAVEEAEQLAEQGGEEAFEWAGKGPFLREQAAGFWGRCVRGASAAGPHLDAWKLWCEVGLEGSHAATARQPK